MKRRIRDDSKCSGNFGPRPVEVFPYSGLHLEIPPCEYKQFFPCLGQALCDGATVLQVSLREAFPRRYHGFADGAITWQTRKFGRPSAWFTR